MDYADSADNGVSLMSLWEIEIELDVPVLYRKWIIRTLKAETWTVINRRNNLSFSLNTSSKQSTRTTSQVTKHRETNDNVREQQTTFEQQ